MSRILQIGQKSIGTDDALWHNPTVVLGGIISIAVPVVGITVLVNLFTSSGVVCGQFHFLPDRFLNS